MKLGLGGMMRRLRKTNTRAKVKSKDLVWCVEGAFPQTMAEMIYHCCQQMLSAVNDHRMMKTSRKGIIIHCVALFQGFSDWQMDSVMW
jgi:hypothetical protein